MKKFILIVCILTIASNLSAQTNFGIKASYLIPRFGFNHYQEIPYESSGGSAGFVIEHLLKENVGIQGEALLSAYVFNIDDTRWWVTTQYLELPIMVKYLAPFGMNLHTGIKLGFNLNTDGQWLSGLESLFGGGFPEDVTNDMSTINVMFPVGIGYKFNFGLFADVRYNLGLSDTDASDKEFFLDRVSSAEFSVGYLF